MIRKTAHRRIIALACATLACAGAPGRADAQAPKPTAARAAPAAGPTATPPAGTPPGPTAPAPNAPVPSTPQQTSATFGDWTLRCTQVDANRACEVVQTLQQNERPIAQFAIGRSAQTQRMQMVVMVPVNVTMTPGASLLAGSEGDTAPLAELAWRRCLPSGCMAETTLDPGLIAKMRAWTEQGRIGFVDGAGHPARLPLSPRGLPQAMDALAKEIGTN